MKVIKRDGRKDKMDISQIRKQTEPSVAGLGLSYEELELDASVSITDGMRTKDLQELFIKTALFKVDVDAPNWTYVAARLKLYDIYHDMKRSYHGKKVSGDVYKAITYRDYLKMMKDGRGKVLLSYMDKVDRFDLDKIEEAIDGKRDLLFNYLAVESLYERYMLQTNGEVLELPQHMFMSEAMFLSQNEENPTEKAIELYHIFSNLEALMATPTLSNGRKVTGSCFSCFVGSAEDTIESIFDGYKNQALISKGGGGIGWDYTRIRALGGTIGDKPGAAGGPIPFLKIENDIAVAVDQLSTRLGAINIFMETWHKDFVSFLDMKKNGGDELRRAKQLFIAASASDEFMRRVRADEEWTMFDPYDVRILTEVHGEEFTREYNRFEQGFLDGTIEFTNPPERVKAKDIMKAIIRYSWDVGMPSLFYKDTVNRDHNNPQLGIIRSANLCMEFLNPVSGDEELAVCNLASVNLAKINTRADFERVIPPIVRALDNVIDLSNYPTKEAARTQAIRRAIGLGIAGEAELIANKHMHYGSDEHLEFIDQLYKDFNEVLEQASIDLGKEKGTWCEESDRRNAYLGCIAPTSSISILMDTTAMHEPAFDKVWGEENALGVFKVTAPRLNTENYEFYRSPYEVGIIPMIKANAIRQKHFDMGISFNLYFDPETTKGKDVFEALMLCWELGLKTTYYVRTGSKKLTSEDVNKANGIKLRDTKVNCFGCGG